MNAYEKLYRNTKSQFTIVNDNKEYTLGELMLIKAGKKKESSILPVSATISNSTRAVSAFFTYVNDKLTVKNPPAKDRTIKKFPLRTSLAAFLSALVVCTFVLSFGLLSGKNIITPATADGDSITEIEETEDNASEK